MASGSCLRGEWSIASASRRDMPYRSGLWALASLSHVLARSPFGFGMARFALGIGESGNFPSALKATADWFPAEERALATGIFNSGTSAGALIAPLMIPWVAVRYGWQAAFYTTGSLGLIWLVGWLLFPYDRLHPKYGNPAPAVSLTVKPATYKALLFNPGTWRFALSKGTTDAIWWFYLFWLPKYFNERFHVDMRHLGPPLIIVYIGATIGSIAGGWLAGFYIRRGHSVRMGRRFAMLVCALCAAPVVFVPFVHPLWQAIALLCLATAAHQGWSSNLLSTPSDMFPSSFGRDCGRDRRSGRSRRQRNLHVPGGAPVDQLCAAHFPCVRVRLFADAVCVSMASAVSCSG